MSNMPWGCRRVPGSTVPSLLGSEGLCSPLVLLRAGCLLLPPALREACLDLRRTCRCVTALGEDCCCWGDGGLRGEQKTVTGVMLGTPRPAGELVPALRITPLHPSGEGCCA